MEAVKAELDEFLSSTDANEGLASLRAQQIISKIPSDEDEAYKYFVDILLQPDASSSPEHSAKSYRAMTILKQDLSQLSLFIKGPTEAGLLAKDLLLGLAKVDPSQRYTTFHIRELLDALLEVYPEKTLSAAAAGGKQAVQEHLGPLLQYDQTLSVLTHLVCIGATGRKGIASAEKSAQHTAMYHRDLASGKNKTVGRGHRRKFVKAMTDFHFLEQLVDALASAPQGEEVCETILTVLEVVGYPPEDPPVMLQQQQPPKKDANEEMVGEDTLLAPLGTPELWKKLLEAMQRPECTYEQKESIARTCHQAFALATGNSSRICKSHAPATDATEQAADNIVEEKEETVTNRLIEWGLTDKMHEALLQQLPLLLKVLDLPWKDVLSFEATFPVADTPDQEDAGFIRHPGRYQTQPLGSWRLQLLSLLKEILCYRGKATITNGSSGESAPCVKAMDFLMGLPVPPDVLKPKKSKGENGAESLGDLDPNASYNPWPALCTLVWAYPHNDFYHILFFQMLQSVVLEHHEPTLRMILQKSKFLSRAVSCLNDKGPMRGVVMNSLNLLGLRSKSLPSSYFLRQYLGSHDGWKASADRLAELTLSQQTPIKGDVGTINLDLKSPFANKLGLGDVDEWGAGETDDGTEDTSVAESVSTSGSSTGGSKKKKKNKKKKK
eukprot:Nitzschia sp. Nitz4//scaffold10_size219509//60243//62401//NITZ4_001411-RA/size219509-augustus-gene-0.267-mRNA-1//-1//CDS//3329532869//9203//frame0